MWFRDQTWEDILRAAKATGWTHYAYGGYGDNTCTPSHMAEIRPALNVEPHDSFNEHIYDFNLSYNKIVQYHWDKTGYKKSHTLFLYKEK